MSAVDAYELVDFGQGRKLERFGEFLLDRPSPAADGQPKSHPQHWRQAVSRFERTRGERGGWRPAQALPKEWILDCGPFRLQLRPTPYGHLGVFPEQFENWSWIRQQVAARDQPLRVLNLFAYTGGSTLAAAAAGAEVVHVDAARNVIRWARENAKLSGLEQAPIRWIEEDARRFVQREQRRGNRYDAVILDPPSYGHGPKGESWKMSVDLLPLLRGCGKLTEQQRAFVLLTGHSPSFGPAEMTASLADALFGHCQAGVAARTLSLATADGRRLPAGVMARFATER